MTTDKTTDKTARRTPEDAHAESGCTDYLQHSASSCPILGRERTFAEQFALYNKITAASVPETPTQRIITYLILEHGTVYAKTEAEYRQQGLPEDWDDFVWQFAPDKETAITQHDDKLDEYIADINAGRDTKATY